MKRLQELLVAIIFLVSTDSCRGSVSLTVEGGVSLVGEHCPGTVKLFCEGVNLPFLRWRYNSLLLEEDEISNPLSLSFIQSSSPSDANRNLPFVENVFKRNPAFQTVQVARISPGQINGTTVANFTTILTVDLVQLVEQNITSIICGHLNNNTDSVAVNVSILGPSFIAPWTLNITNVVATYQSGSLNSVDVEWEKLKLNCDVYDSLAVYELIVNGSKSVSHWVNQTSCGEVVCTAIVASVDISQSRSEFTLKAHINGSLDTPEVQDPNKIEISNRSYFATQINIIDCYVSFQCKSRTWNLDKNTNCSLQYTTNSAYNKLSNPIVAMSGSSVRFLHLVETTQSYFFEFSVTVKEGFVIKERIEKVFPQNTLFLEIEAIIFLFISSLFILLSLVHITIVIQTKVLKIAPALKGKRHFIAMVVLLSMDVVCVLFFILLVLIFNEECSQTPLASQYNVVLYSMMVVACLGITLLLLIWISWGYQVNQYKKAQISRSATREIQENEETRNNQVQPEGKRKSSSASEKNIYDENFLESITQENDLYNSGRQIEKCQNECTIEYDELAQSTVGCNASERMYGNQEMFGDVDENEGVYDDVLVNTNELEQFGDVDENEGVYDDVLVNATELEQLSSGSDVSEQYDRLHPLDNFKPSPGMDDPTYSHIYTEEKQGKTTQA